jgi:hypothetical protein
MAPLSAIKPMKSWPSLKKYLAEEPERYLSVVESFLGCVEASRT